MRSAGANKKRSCTGAQEKARCLPRCGGKPDVPATVIDPVSVAMLQAQYAGIGHRSHLDRRFWISVSLDADVPAAEVARLVADSYVLVCAGLTRKQKAELAALSD